MVRITYLSHAGFLIQGGGARLVVDPFLTGNPNAARRPEEVEADYVLLTHGHPDHVGDGLEIARRCGATVIAAFELGLFCERRGVSKVHTMHIGGSHTFPFGTVKLTPALHGSAFPDEHGITYTGLACGFLVTVEGKTLYHAGDTGLTAEMGLLGERHRIDVALLPIGDNYTMGVEDALHAARLLRAGLVVPMHFGTFPVLTPDAVGFEERARELGIPVRVLAYGESLDLG